MLKLENVCAGYGKLDVLWDVSCEVHDGEFVAIVGPNGAGKTTTMRAISGLVRPKSGCNYIQRRAFGRRVHEAHSRSGCELYHR